MDIYKVIYGFIGAILLLTVSAALIPEATTAGDSINSTGLPLAGLFASDSILPIIIMASLLVGVFAYFKFKK